MLHHNLLGKCVSSPNLSINSFVVQVQKSPKASCICIDLFSDVILQNGHKNRLKNRKPAIVISPYTIRTEYFCTFDLQRIKIKNQRVTAYSNLATVADLWAPFSRVWSFLEVYNLMPSHFFPL